MPRIPDPQPSETQLLLPPGARRRLAVGVAALALAPIGILAGCGNAGHKQRIGHAAGAEREHRGRALGLPDLPAPRPRADRGRRAPDRPSPEPRRPRPTGRCRERRPLACLSSPRSRPSAAVSNAAWSAGRSPSVEVRHPRAVRRHEPGADDFAALLAGRRIDAAARRGKYLWLPLDSGDALVGHLGMSGQLLLVAPATPDGPHLRIRFRFTDEAAGRTRSSRFVDQRTFGGLAVAAGGRGAALRAGAHRARPGGPGVRRRGVRRCGAAGADRAQAGAARPDRGQRHRQHLRRRGAVAGPAALGPADRDAAPPGHPPAARLRAGGAERRDRGRRHVVRRALRQRQRPVRLVRPLAGRLRPGERAVRAVRHADRPRAVHEPLVVPLPALPAGAAAPRY